ncbi:MAG: hypothetical protein R6X13_00490 [bacterium]
MLTEFEKRAFYFLNWTLLFYVSRQLEILPLPESPDAIQFGPEAQWMKLRNALYENPVLFERYADDNPEDLPDELLAEVRSWRHFLRSDFIFFKSLVKHAILLDGRPPHLAYGVLAPNRPLEAVLGRRPPVAVQAVLLPFRGRIVYDGLLSSWPVDFGPGIRAALNEDYRKAKAGRGIITSLLVP